MKNNSYVSSLSLIILSLFLLLFLSLLYTHTIIDTTELIFSVSIIYLVVFYYLVFRNNHSINPLGIATLVFKPYAIFTTNTIRRL